MAPLIIQGWRGTNPSRRSRRQSISSSVFIRVHPWLYKQERLVPHCHVRQRRLTRLGMKPRKRLTATRAATEYRYEKLTWPEINDAIDLGKVCLVPCGAVEQHGPHLPLDVDLVCPGGIAKGAGQTLPDKILVLPIVAYGYTGHVMDFPGTINNDFEHSMHHVLDITKSLADQRFQ